MTTLPFARRDTLPEHQWFPDRGCAVAPACLECPLEQCVDDLTVTDRADRWRGIVELRRQNVPISEIVVRLKISPRTVYRAVQFEGISPCGGPRYQSDRPGKPVSEIGNPIHARNPWPVMPENRRAG